MKRGEIFAVSGGPTEDAAPLIHDPIRFMREDGKPVILDFYSQDGLGSLEFEGWSEALYRSPKRASVGDRSVLLKGWVWALGETEYPHDRETRVRVRGEYSFQTRTGVFEVY